ncbi:hypothetical protein [Aneurinibacillus aneurinilyticus]|uniref:Tape measure protein n=1 Tax=Aneurinibacillus aneurinilyticus TaxID=1391 RepID=A0A848D3G2_ANEAE|nr:hypothetical protein [Aneurinibacillus aneurinilyticus]NMF00231.1 hypothetical protein [Aneurinibacillus aneurinilyticus]
MSNNVGGANIEITADDSQARATLNRFGDELERFGRRSRGFANSGFSYFGRITEKMRSAYAVLQGTEHVLKNITQRLNDTSGSFKRFSDSTNDIQAQWAFRDIERSIRRTRMELSMLGFGRTKTEIQALEGRLYNFANIRMDNLRDQIKLTERALEQMKKSADASKYADKIKETEAALAKYKAQLQDVNAVQKMAEVNGYNVTKAFGKDVFIKPLEGFERFKAQVTGFFNTDLAMLAGKTYKTIDGAAKAIVGSTDTVAEQKRKIQQLTTMYQTMGTTINTMVTPFVVALGAAFAYVGAKAEQAYFKFEAQTLTPRADMKEYKEAMADVYAETGQAREEVSKVFAFLKNKYDATAEAAKSLATKGADFSDVWGSGDAQTSIQSIETMRKTMRLLKVDEEQAANALALALKRTNGDWNEATKSLTQYGDIYKKLVSGQKITEVDARAAAERNVTKAIRDQAMEYTRLQREKKRLEKQRDATKDPNQKAFLNQAIANVESDMKRMQENLGKSRDEMLQREIKLMMQLQELDPLNAYQNMGDAEAGVEAMLKAWRNFTNQIEELFDALSPTLESIGNKLTDMAEAATEFLRNNPGFASFVAHMLAGGAALTVLIGLLAPLAFGLLFAKDAFLAIGLAMKGLQAGAIAVLPPKVVQMAKSFDMFKKSIAGLPRILAGLGPALATMFRVAPAALTKFIVDFVKLNPLLTAFSLLATVIIDNWDRVGPVLSQIWKDVLLAFKPVVQAFQDANGSVWPTVQKALESISRIAGTVLVDALKTIEPVIRGIAAVINGDLKGAASAFGDFASSFQSVGSLIGGVAIAWGVYKTAVVGATMVQSAFATAQGIALTSTTLLTTGLTRATGALTALRFAFMANPVGLVVTGLSLAVGAATLFANKTEEVKEVTLEHFDSLNKQRGALENTVREYDSLRDSMKLSETELLRYMDLQTKIAETTDPTLLAMYKDEQAQLAQKSGLTADQLERFFKVNGDLIQQAPETEQAISAQGNALAKSADAAKKLVAELAKKSQMELDAQKATANANLTEQINQYVAAVQKSNELYQAREVYQGRVLQAERDVLQAEKELQTAKENGNSLEVRRLEERLTNLRGALELERNTVEAKATGLVEAQKEVEKLEAALGKTNQIYEALINKRAQQAGINAEIGKEVDAINAALQNHIKTRDALLKKKQAGEQLTAEQQKQLEKTEAEIEKLNEAKTAIKSLKGEQEKVNQKIQEGTGEAKKLNENLREQINKQVTINVDDRKARSILEDLSKPRQTTFTIVEKVQRVTNPVSNPGVQEYFYSKGNPPKRHSGGTVHELPKFHTGGSPALMGTPPKVNEVDVRLLRNEMVLTKEQQANLFNMIKSFKSVVAKRVTDAKSIIDGANKIMSQAAQKLSNPQEDAVISKTMAEIKKNAAVASQGGKKQTQATTQNKAFAEAKKTAEFKFDKGIINAQQYIAVLKQIDAQYAKTPEHHRQVNEAISKAEAARIKIISEQSKKQFEESKKWIDERKFYGELTLEQELAAWNRAIGKLQKGTEEFANAQKEIYRVKQEINRAGFENSKRWIDEQKYYNKLSLDEELAAWRRVQARYKAGTAERKEADREVYRVQIELLNKAAEDKYKATMDDIERETKAVQEIAQRQKEAIESRRDAALDSLKREEKAEMDSLARRQKAYERDHQARMKMLDDETNAAIKRIQAEIDAIDKQGRDQDYAYKDADRQKELAELRKQYDKYKVSASAAGQKKAADLLKQIEKIQTEIERDEQARRREQQKESLKEQMDNIKEAADKKKEQWQSEFDRQKEWFEQEKEQRQEYYQQREAQLKASFDAELRALEDSTKRQLAQLEQQKFDAEQTRTKMLEDARQKAQENLNVVESGQQQAINVLQNKNQDYYRSGQTLGNMFAYGLESSASRIKEAATKIAKIVSNRLELHSPAKEGPLATLNKWWNAMPETLLAGLDDAPIKAAMNAMVNPNLSFGSLGAVGEKAMASTSSVKQEYNFERMFEGANFVIRDEQDIRSLGREFGSYVVNSTKTTDRARGRK